MKALHLLIAAKLVALAGAGGFLYAEHQAKAQAQESKASAESPTTAQAKTDELPVIPEKGLSLSRAAEIRNQLLLMRRDVEQKIAQLQVAQRGYDRSKESVDAKLKRIEEERRLLEETLQKERKAKQERLSDALQFVAKMEPQKAAPLLENMDRDLVMQLLRQLPPRQVTKLLESVNPKKATEFLEYYTRIRSGREYELLREMGLCASGQEGEFDGKQESGESKSDGKAEESAKSGESAGAGAENPAAAQQSDQPESRSAAGAAESVETSGRVAAKSNEPASGEAQSEQSETSAPAPDSTLR
jgi:flagellar motility protein MotE (MotC chaperone)